MRQLSQVAILSAFVCTLFGCGGGGAPVAVATDAEFMTDVKELLQEAGAQLKRAPAKQEEVSKLEPSHPGAVKRIKMGTIIVVWGVPIGTAGQGVLAYEKTTADKGGPVLLEDGTIKTMTAAEFAAAPKAAKK